MPTKQLETEVRFTVALANIPEAIKLKAESKAKEAYLMTLLKHGDITSGRAARLLGMTRLQVLDLMSGYDISPFDDTMTLEEFQSEVEQAAEKLDQNNK